MLIGLLAGALDALYGGPAALAFVIGGVAWVLFSWFLSSRVVAGVTGAHVVTKAEQPELYRIVENMSIAAGLPLTPEVRLIDDPAPNAFAAGRDPKHTFVAVTTGLLETMDQRELEGVISHEIAHVQHRDVRLMTLVAVLVGVIAMISDITLRMTLYGGGRRRGGNAGAIVLVVGLVGLIIAPLAAVGIQMSISAGASPGRRRRSGDLGGRRGTRAGAAQARRRRARDPRHEPLDRTPLHRGPARQGERPAQRLQRPLQPPPAARGPHRRPRDDRRLPAALSEAPVVRRVRFRAPPGSPPKRASRSLSRSGPASGLAIERRNGVDWPLNSLIATIRKWWDGQPPHALQEQSLKPTG